MNDPLPENVEGQKIHQVSHEFSHNVEHHIPWGQVMLGIGLLGIAYVGYKSFLSSPDREAASEEEIGEPVNVEWTDAGGDLLE